MENYTDISGINCFGEESAIYTNTIKEFIDDEIRDSVYYDILARRAPNQTSSRMFQQFSNDELNHARRFSTALYLITNQRYFPRIFDLEPVIVPSYEQALLQRFRAESKDAIKYPQFAGTVKNDRCLKRLAIETGKAEEEHANEIFEILQNMNS